MKGLKTFVQKIGNGVNLCYTMNNSSMRTRRKVPDLALYFVQSNFNETIFTEYDPLVISLELTFVLSSLWNRIWNSWCHHYVGSTTLSLHYPLF